MIPNRTIIERDQAMLWHPYTTQKGYLVPIALTQAKDTLLYDSNGKQYIDAISSWWVTLHGHSNAFIAEAVYKQMLTLAHVSFSNFTHEPAVDLAESLLHILPPNMSRIFYSDNGSTAVEVSVKMCLQYWWNQNTPATRKRKKIVVLTDSYHGDTFGCMSVSEKSTFTHAFQDYLFEVIQLPRPDTHTIQDSINLLKQQADNIAGFIYEPLIQGAGGMKMYDASLLQELLLVCKQLNIICIADEVMTGFGRTGKLFASSYMAEQPDIICLSKGLTGGYLPLGVTACTHAIYKPFFTDDRTKTFYHGHSFTANPVGCATALASLTLLRKEETMRNIERIKGGIEKMVDWLKADQSLPFINVRSIGTILAFEVADSNHNYLNPIAPKITAGALADGVFIRPLGNTVYLMPPYCITDDELNRVFECFKKIPVYLQK
ncbi:MAG: adenosylmethionine--8-amino-7-oxononanoate transaminase [Phycisphaerales bacterium]|nr:adenosylmethionine--8-amino-7-oxononanoate transaminase [Phycisphaerales bacterium]